MKQILIDNGNSYCSPEEALQNYSLNFIAMYMDDDIREKIIREENCETDVEFLEKYLKLANENLIIG